MKTYQIKYKYIINRYINKCCNGRQKLKRKIIMKKYCVLYHFDIKITTIIKKREVMDYK